MTTAPLIELKLFVYGPSELSVASIRNTIRIGKERFGDSYRLEIIDVGEQPEVAEAFNILVTPTLMRVSPKPQLRLIGDLNDANRVLGFLKMVEPATAS